jgi:predicted type IV restriction endonuclease
MSRKVTLNLDDTFEAKVRRRVEQLQARREAELREAGYTEKADDVADSEPDMADYMRSLVLEDLKDTGMVDR